VNARFTSAAKIELTQAIEFYEAAEAGLGGRFYDEVDATINRIVSFPLAWTLISPNTRRCRVNHFPYALFYQIMKDEIVIVTVMDLRRDPIRWEQYK
jgi:hypothetical protein